MQSEYRAADHAVDSGFEIIWLEDPPPYFTAALIADGNVMFIY